MEKGWAIDGDSGWSGWLRRGRGLVQRRTGGGDAGGIEEKRRARERPAALALVTRGPGTWPPSATGRGWGPQDASYRAAMTQQIVGGYGVSVSERSSPAPCVSRSAEWSEAGVLWSRRAWPPSATLEGGARWIRVLRSRTK